MLEFYTLKYMAKVTFNQFFNNLIVNEMIYYSPPLTWFTLFLVYIRIIDLLVMYTKNKVNQVNGGL